MAVTPLTTPTDPIKKIGDDATATFETDPKFTEPTPGSEGSSDNIEEQQDEYEPALKARDTDDLADSDEEEDVDEDEEFDEDEEDDDDLEDDVEDEDDLDDEDEDDEDEEEEVTAASLRDSDLPGYDDERVRLEDDDAGDVDMGVSEDEFTQDDMDTDRVAALAVFSAHVAASLQHSL